MEPAMLIVLLGIGFFLVTGLFGGLGFYNVIKNRRKQAFIYFGIGFFCIAVFIISLFLFIK